MSNVNVPSGLPQKVVYQIQATAVASKPGNATYVGGGFTVPTIVRPDGQAAAAATGGSANCRFKVTAVRFTDGATTDGAINASANLVLNVVNFSNANASVAAKTIANTAVATIAKNLSVDLTLATTATTRNSVSVPDITLLGGDVLNVNMVGDNANTLVSIYSYFQLEGEWEQQIQGGSLAL